MSIARSMVMDYGMSGLGRVNYRESSRSPFLATGGDFQREHSHSEQTAREIDEEVKRIIDESMEKVLHILETRMASLKALGAADRKGSGRFRRAERDYRSQFPQPAYRAGHADGSSPVIPG